MKDYIEAFDEGTKMSLSLRDIAEDLLDSEKVVYDPTQL